MSPLRVFVPGPLYNPMNSSHGHWSKRARWARTWRERTSERLRVALLVEHRRWRFVPSDEPKQIVLHARTWNAFDSDGLSAALKPVRDGLRDAQVIQDDGPGSGHEFTYEQEINRAHRGVVIDIALKGEV